MLTDLPPDVLAQLAPAIEAVRMEAQQAVRLVEGRRIDRAGRATAQRNGNGGYLDGHCSIMASVFTTEELATMKSVDRYGQPLRGVPACECRACSDAECAGYCESCEDTSCVQCHGDGCECSMCSPECDTDACCGYCGDCGTCHGDGRDSSRDVGNGRYRYCRECDHECDD